MHLMPVESSVVPGGQSQRKEPRVLTQTPPPLQTSTNIEHSSMSTYTRWATMNRTRPRKTQNGFHFNNHKLTKQHRYLESYKFSKHFGENHSIFLNGCTSIRRTETFGFIGPSCTYCSLRHTALAATHQRSGSGFTAGFRNTVRQSSKSGGGASTFQ